MIPAAKQPSVAACWRACEKCEHGSWACNDCFAGEIPLCPWCGEDFTGYWNMTSKDADALVSAVRENGHCSACFGVKRLAVEAVESIGVVESDVVEAAE